MIKSSSVVNLSFNIPPPPPPLPGLFKACPSWEWDFHTPKGEAFVACAKYFTVIITQYQHSELTVIENKENVENASFLDSRGSMA